MCSGIGDCHDGCHISENASAMQQYANNQGVETNANRYWEFLCQCLFNKFYAVRIPFDTFYPETTCGN